MLWRMQTSFAVITGDLIKSTGLTTAQLTRAMDTLRAAATDISLWQNGAPAYFTTYRGDGWQMLVQSPALTLRAVLYMRACLRTQGKVFSTRAALATGTGPLPDGPDLNRANGPVFVASGRALDGMGDNTGLIWAAGGPLGAVTRLADHISHSWTPAQATALREMLPPTPNTHTQAAKTIGISRQAVEKALAGAGYPALNEALTLLETAMQPK